MKTTLTKMRNIVMSNQGGWNQAQRADSDNKVYSPVKQNKHGQPKYTQGEMIQHRITD